MPTAAIPTPMPALLTDREYVLAGVNQVEKRIAFVADATLRDTLHRQGAALVADARLTADTDFQGVQALRGRLHLWARAVSEACA